MPKITEISHVFVDSAPPVLEPAVLYVSVKYRAIVHLCLCGCNEKVFLNLDADPDSWSFTFDGRTISVHDSVGNFGIPCRSHYIVRNNRVIWLSPLLGIDPKRALEEGRRRAKQAEPTPKGFRRWLQWRHQQRHERQQ
jgi:hypothetical protein